MFTYKIENCKVLIINVIISNKINPELPAGSRCVQGGVVGERESRGCAWRAAT